MKYTSASVRERPGKGWQGILKYKEVTPDGNGGETTRWKAIYKTFGKVGKAEAKRQLRKWHAEKEAEAENTIVRPTVRVADYVGQYVDTLEESGAVERSTISGYRTTQKHIAAGVGDVPLCDLNGDTVQRWINSMNKSGLSASTVRKALILLRAAVRQAEEDGLIDRDPLKKVKTPKIKAKSDPNVLDAASKEKLVSVLNVMDVTPVSLGVRIALSTGMREGEICGLRWADVDFEQGKIHVRKAVGHDRGRPYIKEPKTRKSHRKFDIPPSLVPFLEKRHADMQAAYGENPLPGDYYVLGDICGEFFPPHELWRGWKYIVRDYGLKGTLAPPTFHDLRHTYATYAIASGQDVKSVSSVLGHARASVTLDIYASSDEQAKSRTIKSVDKVLFGNQAPVIDFKAVVGE